jgi:hypothetical protein
MQGTGCFLPYYGRSQRDFGLDKARDFKRFWEISRDFETQPADNQSAKSKNESETQRKKFVRKPSACPTRGLVFDIFHRLFIADYSIF